MLKAWDKTYSRVYKAGKVSKYWLHLEISQTTHLRTLHWKKYLKFTVKFHFSPFNSNSMLVKFMACNLFSVKPLPWPTMTQLNDISASHGLYELNTVSASVISIIRECNILLYLYLLQLFSDDGKCFSSVTSAGHLKFEVSNDLLRCSNIKTKRSSIWFLVQQWGMQNYCSDSRKLIWPRSSNQSIVLSVSLNFTWVEFHISRKITVI